MIAPIAASLLAISPPALPDAPPIAAAPAPSSPLTQGDPENLGRWTGAVSIGASVSSGNTNKRTATATADAQLRRENDRWKFNAYWSYADQKVDGVRQLSERKLGGTGQYDYFLTKRLFAYVSAGGQYDAIAELDLRTTIGTGLGYQLYEREDLKWALEGGIAWVDENYVDDTADNDFIAARAASDLAWTVREGVDFLQRVEVFPSLEDSDDVYGRADQRLRVALTKTMFAQLQYVLEYDNTPAPGKDRLDHLVALTLGLTF
jgi:putative salt-induced outer membrane protein YdiY